MFLSGIHVTRQHRMLRAHSQPQQLLKTRPCLKMTRKTEGKGVMERRRVWETPKTVLLSLLSPL